VTWSRPDIERLLAEQGLSPRRALGQNFVADPNTVRRIVRLAGIEAGCRVVEVGAGLGSLTIALAEAGADVTAVELDAHLVALLRPMVEPLGVRVVEADALRVDWATALDPSLGPWRLVANLPYNVATPLVMLLLEQAPALDRLFVMVQAEVGERFAALPGTAAYGAVSVLIAYWAQARVVGRVAPTVFVPRPKVDSALVAIDRRPVPAVDPAAVAYERLKVVVRAGFGQRRKMLRRSLADVVSPEAFAAAGVRPEERAEQLDVAAWGRLAAWRP